MTWYHPTNQALDDSVKGIAGAKNSGRLSYRNESPYFISWFTLNEDCILIVNNRFNSLFTLIYLYIYLDIRNGMRFKYFNLIQSQIRQISFLGYRKLQDRTIISL